MRLENRNLTYSLVLAAVLVLFLVGYFVFMLPSLYLAHMREENLDSIVEQHKAYMERKSYEGVRLMNPSACLTLEIPTEGSELLLTNAFVTIRVTAWSEGLEEILEEIRQLLKADTLQMDEDTLEKWAAALSEEWQDVELPVQIKMEETNALEVEYHEEGVEVHRIADNLIVVEHNVQDTVNHYTTYLAVTRDTGSIILSFLPAMTTEINEIRFVVVNSLPMIIAVIVVVVLAFSHLYSKGIIRPLFQSLQEKNEELNEKNRILREDNERQEVFLRASSHQLKTPVAAALLLVDGMTGRVGKYTDYDTYLPKVKEQLLAMRTMIEDILSLGRSKDGMQKQQLSVVVILENVLRQYEITCQAEGVSVDCQEVEPCRIEADPVLLFKIIDNLVSNALRYCGKQGIVSIRLYRDHLKIENTGHIPDAVEAHIFEPFVTGNNKKKSGGLGLYIAAFYARQMGAGISVRNAGESVVGILEFPNC